jgi:hypothetical protein
VIKNKSDLKEKIKALLTDLKIAGLSVRFIRCDDAGENMPMKNDLGIKSFGVKFEFSAPRTPQKMESLKENCKHFIEGSGQC